ncbi:hypothetical protein CHLRE_10g448350v5 [Chlamydomonas reinhardtii]|uniref:Uncharacterized protein n=1 Tax=Chlamydomonas reinhardtii TaxID=3055 RepID=A0A2K3DB00_CHLRE|nr:uncharacterized protein CHLRE_10g448350v5 [Chlamydomonas reinhardtii]PNW77710.1 hypothetical protein CHLRE_10g448350v5 [Chlamydomonas reinhardtii]
MASGVWPFFFALCLTAGVAVALLYPHTLDQIQLDANLTLGLACFFLGLSCNAAKLVDLFGTPLGLGNLAFSSFNGTFVWPALGLAATALAVQSGLPFAVAVGLALLAACPVGGPSNAVNVHNAGGSLEASVLLCAVFTPAALITFPYAFHHFVLFLLDQPLVDDASRGADAAAAAAEAELRAHLKAAAGAVGGTVTPAVMAAIRNHALLSAALPIALGVALSATVLPQRLAAQANRFGPMAAASMIVLTCVPKTAANAAAVAAAGPEVVGWVAALHVVALVLGYLIPAGVGSPARTCRTSAFQTSMRNPALGLMLAAALFGATPHFPLVAAPCIISIFIQNTLGAWSALAAGLRANLGSPERLASEQGTPLSPRALQTQSKESILKQPTVRRLSNPPTFKDYDKED